MVLKCPKESVVPVQAIARMVASRQSVGGLDPVEENFKPIATGPDAATQLGEEHPWPEGELGE